MPFSLLCLQQPLLFSPFKTSIALQHQKNLGFFKQQKLGSSHARIRQSVAVRCSSNLPSFHDFEGGGDMVRELFGRAEGLLYTIADAAANASDASSDVVKPNRDWFSGITDCLEAVLKILKDGLSALHVPYAYGFAIIFLTVLVKAATFPLTKKQVESAMAMRSLQPQIKAIQELYSGDQERIKSETVRLYKLAGVNPLAGCLPTIMTMPIWIGLYRAFSNVADEGLLMEGFFWIPSLSGPTTIAARQNGAGISWLFPFVDGHPPLGWSNTFAYLVLPVLLVISQYISIQIMQSSQVNYPNQNVYPALTKFLPLMIGYFALSVPSGLSLYWLTSNILSTGQQIWLQKLGGAKNPVTQYNDPSFPNEPQIQKPLVDIDNKKLEHIQTDKTLPGALRRGERFKQIKEQEAIKKQQREEEKGKAEAATRNVEHKQVPELPKANHNAEAGFIAVEDKTVNSMTVIHDSMKAEAAAAENVKHKEELEFLNANDNSEAGFLAVEDKTVHSNTVIDDSTNPETPSVNVGESSQDSGGDQTRLGELQTRNGVAYNSSNVVNDEKNSH